MKVKVDQDLCIGCGTCELMCSQCFQLEDGKAQVMSDNCDNVDCDIQEVIDSCPVEAISIVSEGSESAEKTTN